MAKDPFRFFRIEARELVDQLSSGVIALEGKPAEVEALAKLLRIAHTMKGAARVVKLAEIADIAHAIEDILTPYREGGLTVPPEHVGNLLAKLDAIGAALAALPGPDGEQPSQAAPSTPAAPAAPARQARADLAEVGDLLDGLGEIGRELAWMRDVTATVSHIHGMVAELTEQLEAPRVNMSSSTAQRAGLAKAHALAEEVGALVVGVERSMSAGVERIERELRQARDTTERLRLVPASSLFSALERATRDAAQSAGKQVHFEASGGDVLLDGQVIDMVQNALVQVVRNAVAHGIESAAERKSSGKPATGRVHLKVERRGYRVSFQCVDDGRGIDFEAVRLSAIRQGNLSPDVVEVDAKKLLALLLKGGISTSSSLTQLSGRGIGLDIVREAAHRLNGELRADTVALRGTTLELTVPVSLAAVDALMIELDNQIAAIPLEAVRRTQRLGRDDIARSADGDSILHNGKLIPLLSPRLSRNQRAKPGGAKRAISAVILSVDDTITAIDVDRLLGTETVVLRPLPALATADPIVLGSCLDNEGNPCLVLDPIALTTLRHTVAAVEDAAGERLPILVIDDSLTTRMLEQSILESAGLLVETASSAEEALERVRHKRYALFLVDVEMPGMDGFSFIERTRADPRLCEIPCILVTSCDSEEDRRRGKAAGAVAHIIKGEFDQVEFLQRVHSLVQP